MSEQIVEEIIGIALVVLFAAGGYWLLKNQE
jgi:hypothetical protein